MIKSFSVLRKENCNDIYSIPLIAEHNDSCLFYFRFKICEPSFATTTFSVGFNSVKNFFTGMFLEV